ncbi:MAG: triphosphoribosyl-dephospho-CoA synthase CitG [Fusobacteriaceae bacterium]|jgi:triphosphoribosyl-dephospho-CoA synthase CitG|nr:triphosphoribosyl-dephospho-CoA synthase CitG [Fusobacteriaceae bacterium]
MYEEFCEQISAWAIESMLSELSATPKPGLVDRNNSGAHRDMDFFTFIQSASALHLSFYKMTQLGKASSRRPIERLLPLLRALGREAEAKMYSATKGVNTHKGAIFSLGLACATAGWLYDQEILSYETICDNIRILCVDLCKDDFQNLSNKKKLTKGERMYMTYGFKGARGEAESGYQTVCKIALPVFSQMISTGYSRNDAIVQTLLHLIAHTLDTNILSRHDLSVAQYAQQYASKVIALGGVETPAGRAALLKMDQDFIDRYISPGGCADLLAVTGLFHRIQENDTLSTLENRKLG